MIKDVLEKREAIVALVQTAVKSYATGFQARHEVEKPTGTLNMKIHNVFIAALGSDIQYYSALVRSLDSSLGNMLEGLVISIAKFSYKVQRKMGGPLGPEQISKIAQEEKIFGILSANLMMDISSSLNHIRKMLT